MCKNVGRFILGGGDGAQKFFFPKGTAGNWFLQKRKFYVCIYECLTKPPVLKTASLLITKTLILETFPNFFSRDYSFKYGRSSYYTNCVLFSRDP
jgi:hypothetical protein